MKVERDKSVPPKRTPRKRPAPPNSSMAVERAYVDAFEHRPHGLLDDFVFQRGDPQRTHFAVRLGNPTPFGWLPSVFVTRRIKTAGVLKANDA